MKKLFISIVLLNFIVVLAVAQRYVPHATFDTLPASEYFLRDTIPTAFGYNCESDTTIRIFVGYQVTEKCYTPYFAQASVVLGRYSDTGKPLTGSILILDDGKVIVLSRVVKTYLNIDKRIVRMPPNFKITPLNL